MSYILPVLILALLVYAWIKRVDVYSAFIAGAKEALPLLLQILPFMAAMMTAISVFRGSGAMELITDTLSPVFGALGMPGELVPMFVLRPFSGSAAMALLNDVFNSSGVDSFAGFAASIMLGSTETVFYTIALYFGTVRIKRTRHTVAASLIAGAAGAAAAIALAYLF